MRARPRRRTKRLVAWVALGVVVIVGGLVAAGAGGLLLRDSAKPAPLAAVVARLRRTGSSGGVYVYATHGGESVRLLVGARHAYPSETGLTATRVPCGVRLRWDALESRSTTWTLCRTRLGLELRSMDEIHRFFGQTDRTTYTCAGAVLVPVDRRSGDRPFRCRSARDTQTGLVHSFGLERVRIGGRSMPAAHVRMAGLVAGGDRGTETVSWWLQPTTGLPLRLVLGSRTSRPLPLGRASYRESVELRLVSTHRRR